MSIHIFIVLLISMNTNIQVHIPANRKSHMKTRIKNMSIVIANCYQSYYSESY